MLFLSQGVCAIYALKFLMYYSVILYSRQLYSRLYSRLTLGNITFLKDNIEMHKNVN